MLDLLAPVVELFFRLAAQPVDLVLAFQDDLLLLGLRGLDGVADDALRLVLSGADGGLGFVLPVADAQDKCRRPGDGRR